MQQVELSFVIPAYNEEDFIEDTLGTIDEVIKDKNLPYEIVVVNDGSRDDTLAKARRYAGRNGHVKVVSYSENVGKGSCCKDWFYANQRERRDFCGRRHGNRLENYFEVS